MSDLAIVFPGQGAQYVGMGKDLADSDETCRGFYKSAGEILGFDLGKLCFEGPPEELARTTNTQPALLVTSLAAYHLVKGLAGEALVMAGHSLGEYTALAAAGAFDFATAVELVSKRAKFMTAAAADGVGGMAAILGLEQDVVAEACSAAAADETVVVANINSPGQVVISGHKAAVERAMEIAKDKGAKRAVRLAVSGPFHSPLLKPAAEKMASLLEEKAGSGKMMPPHTPIVANCSAEATRETAAITEALARQIDNPVRWVESVKKMHSMGARRYLEVGPRVVGPMIKKILPEAEVDNVKDMASLEEYRKKVNG